MNIETPLDEARAHRLRNPCKATSACPKARVIARGDPARSVLLYRMATAGRGHMPYLGAQAGR